jgi:predicted nuclease of predicted toxin-antitoxin system
MTAATFLADECVGWPTIQAVQQAGFNVEQHSGALLPGIADKYVLAYAHAQGRVVLTEDNDFGEQVVRLGLPTLGIVRLDLEGLPSSARARRAVEALKQVGDQVKGALVTIEAKRTRIRQL